MDLEVLRSQDLPFWGPLQIWDPSDPGYGPHLDPLGTPSGPPKGAYLGGYSSPG